jgi:hypothetical protein
MDVDRRRRDLEITIYSSFFSDEPNLVARVDGRLPVYLIPHRIQSTPYDVLKWHGFNPADTTSMKSSSLIP